ncbi:hypothetical protein [Geobacter sp.]|uniref:hypothetical protein n=1 Tax=Geobacter sp. TaxID=46610 RepID=UPI002608820E|nr:hypothetical protein [Geobacter sp.]
MKTLVLLISGILIAATNLYAANGDLVVNGNLGVGTTTPAAKIDVNGNVQLSGNYNITTRKGLLMMGTTDGSVIDPNTPNTADLLLGGIGFVGNGYQTAELTFRAGWGFEMVDRSDEIPDLNYARDAKFYTDLTLRELIATGNLYSAQDVWIDGTLNASVKNFDIKDPRYNDENKRLVHSSLEGPEIGVYYRGEVKLDNGVAVVTLPAYFEALTRQENRTVLLTPKFEKPNEILCSVAASEVKDGQFSIYAFGVMNVAGCNHKVYWEVKAERSDTAKLLVEQDMNTASKMDDKHKMKKSLRLR